MRHLGRRRRRPSAGRRRWVNPRTGLALGVEDLDPVTDGRHQFHVVVDQDHAAVEVCPDPQDEFAQRLRLVVIQSGEQARRAAGREDLPARALASSTRRRWYPYGSDFVSLPAHLARVRRSRSSFRCARDPRLDDAFSPTRTFSHTVSSAKSFRFWKVRPRPERARALLDAPVLAFQDDGAAAQPVYTRDAVHQGRLS